MAFPVDLTTVIVTGTWLNLDGSFASGTVTFQGQYTLSNLTDDTFVIIDKIEATLDASGHISVVLPVADDPQWFPQGWTYAITERISDRVADRNYSIFLTSVMAPTVDLTTIAPVPPSGTPTIYILQSEKGQPNGVAGLDGHGGLRLAGPLAVAPDSATPGATVTLDASLGNIFRWIAGQPFTLAAPINPIDGETIRAEITQDGVGSRVMTLATGAGAFIGSADIPLASVILSTGANLTDIVGFQYTLPSNRWRVVAFQRGFTL